MESDEAPTAPEQWTRCWLVSWTTLLRATSAEVKSRNFTPSLALDVSRDQIKVSNLNSNAVVATAPLAQSIATPAARLGDRFERRYVPKGMPVLVVSVPGAPPMTIGCMEPRDKLRLKKGYGYGFTWRGQVPETGDPAYVVSGAGWLTLVDAFGLTAQLDGDQPAVPPTASFSESPALYSIPSYAKVLTRLSKAYLVIGVLFILALLVAMTILGHA